MRCIVWLSLFVRHNTQVALTSDFRHLHSNLNWNEFGSWSLRLTTANFDECCHVDSNMLVCGLCMIREGRWWSQDSTTSGCCEATSASTSTLRPQCVIVCPRKHRSARLCSVRIHPSNLHWSDVSVACRACLVVSYMHLWEPCTEALLWNVW